MTRRLLRLRYAAWGAYCYLLRLLPYFPHPTAWHFCLDLAEEQRDLIRAELATAQASLEETDHA